MKKRQALRNPVFLLPIFLILLLAACHPEPVMPQDASVLILSPSAESTQSSSTVTIDTYLYNFIVVDSAGNVLTRHSVQYDHESRQGHLVYYQDVTPPMRSGNTTLTAQGTYAISIDTSHTWNSVSPGKHVFWVQLVNKDNTPLTPPQADRVYVTVK